MRIALSRGITLVETMVAISLFTLLMLAVTGIITHLYKINAYTLEQAYEVNHARRGIELAVRDMREMTYADNGAYPLVEMGTSTVGFYSDIDRDNSVEFVRYRLSTTTLYKYVYNATGTPLTYGTSPDQSYTVSEYVQNNKQATSTFRYFLENGIPATATSTVTDIRYIELMVVINIDPNRSPGQFTLRSSAAPRNLKTSF